MNNMPGLLVLYNLLARASSLPCSNGARAFLSLLTSEDDWLSLAFDGFIPALQNQNIQIPQRILAAYVLHALYVSHGHGTNPFYNHLLRIFESERKIALTGSSVKSSLTSSSQRIDLSHVGAGMQGENEQLVWILWKILRGEADELAPYSPDMLSQAAIPEDFRTAHLVTHEKSGSGKENRIATLQMPSTGLIHTKPASVASPNLTIPQSSYPTVSRPSHNTLNPTPEQTPSRRFSPFDDEIPHFGSQTSSSGQVVNSNGRLQDASMEFHSRQPHSQPNMPGELKGDSKLSAFLLSAHSGTKPDRFLSTLQTPDDQRYKANEDGGRRALFRTLHEKPYMHNTPDPRQNDVSGIGNRSIENQNGGGRIRREPNHIEHQSQLSNSVFARPHVPTVSPLPQFFLPDHPGTTHNVTSDSALNGFQASSDTINTSRQRPNPISRPQPHSLSQHNTIPYSGASTSTLQLFSNNEMTPSIEATRSDHKSSQVTSMPVNGNSQQTFGVPYAQQRRVPTPTRVPQSARSPGVIGSGRPSSVSGRKISADNSISNQSSDNTGRSSQMTPIGNGRTLLASQSRDVTGESPNKIPFSVSRVGNTRGEMAKTPLGAIGKPHISLGGNKSQHVNEPLGLIEELATFDIGQKQNGSSAKFYTAPISNTSQSPDLGLTHKRDVSENAATGLPSVSLRSQEHLPPGLSPSEKRHVSISAPAADNSIKNEAVPVAALPSSTPGPSLAPVVGPTQPQEFHKQSRLSPVRAPEDEGSSEVHIDGREQNELAHAIILLLCARDRVLTLSEQRMLQPHLTTLTQPLSLLRPVDLPPLVTNNPDIAAKLLVLLLDRREEDAADIEQLLGELGNGDLIPSMNGSLDKADTSSSANSMPAFEAIQKVVKFVTTCGASTETTGLHAVSPFGGREAKEGYLDALRQLPPIRQSFNIIAKLLNPTRSDTSLGAEQEDSSEVRVATLVRIEVLGGFVNACVGWIERAEQQAREGEVHDDRVAVAVSNLCRFYSSLLKHGFVSAASEVDTAEIMSFALQFSRFEEARSLYSTLVAART